MWRGEGRVLCLRGGGGGGWLGVWTCVRGCELGKGWVGDYVINTYLEEGRGGGEYGVGG